MCGIIGIIGQNDAAPRLLEGLKRLEYRGYDSAGIATLNNGSIQRCRAKGKLIKLEEKLSQQNLNGSVGIGHTRWATHGKPTENNAHPHATDKVAVVHNGIIENYAQLKEELEKHQACFETETDTEVIAHLATYYLKQGMSPKEATNATFNHLEGAFAIVMIFTGEHNLMIGTRHGTPLAIGYGDKEMFIASDSYALAPLTKKICFLEDGDCVIATREGADIYVNDKTTNKILSVKRKIQVTAQSGAQEGKGEYDHFMLKEIYEQPAVIAETLNTYVQPSTGRINIPDDVLNALISTPRLTLIACGTAFYACMVAKYWFEQVARIPCEIDVASEFRYREAPMPKDGLCIFVSQSGETLDTLEALRYVKSQESKILSIVNTIESTIERESDIVFHTLAGPEIGVASTKAFTTQLTTLACMAFAAARAKKAISIEQMQEIGEALRHVPSVAADILRHDEAIRKIAQKIKQAPYVLYLARGSLFPIALEGALKLKEISYIYAEGYAAGEMKHGPIALIDKNVPAVVVAPGNDPLFDKTASNVQEAVARGAKIFLITDKKGQSKLADHVKWSIILNDVHSFVAPIAYAIPVQLLAYHVGVAKNTDVDQPRNLAKSVTVE